MPDRIAHHRRYLMCRPEYFTVRYSINPWMEPARPTDTAKAVRQWQTLYDTYLALGHEVELIDPLPGLPDMVYTANGGFVVDGRALGVRFRVPERRGEERAFMDWFAAAGFEVIEPVEVQEGEGDFLLVGDTILAGTGFRSTGDSHREVADVFGREVVSLRLIDPRFYHLDTAICVLDPVEGEGGVDAANIAYLPSAFDEASLRLLEERYPDPHLLPADPTDRAIVRAMAALIACDIHPLNNLRVLNSLRTYFAADDAQVNAWIARWIADGFAALETMITRHGTGFCFGDAPTLADCHLVPQLYSAERFGVDLTPYPALVAAGDRLRALPEAAAAHPDAQPDADL